MKYFTTGFAALLFFASVSSAQENKCANVKIFGNGSCKNIHVYFDLSACGDPYALPAKFSKCDETSASVFGYRGSRHYFAKLKLISGTWVVDNEMSNEPERKAIASPTPPSEPPVPVAPPEKGLSALSLTGGVQLRAQGDDFTDLATARDFFSIRIRPKFKYAADDKMDVIFEPQFAKYFGDKTYNANPTSSPAGLSNISQNTSGTNFDNSVGFHEGYVEYHSSDTVTFLFGRQILEYGDELIIGPADWELIGRSFDALKMRLKYGLGVTDLFFSKIVDQNVTTNGIGDADFYGLYHSWDLGKGLHAVDLYLLHNQDATSGKKQTTEAVGVRLKSDLKNTALENFDYRIEVTKEYGTAVANGNSAYQADTELGYNFNWLSKWRIGGEFAIAGVNYNQLYPSPHQWLGYADLFGRKNIKDWVVHLSAQPNDSLTVGLDLHRFLRNSIDVPLIRTTGATFPKPLTSRAKNVATEWDLIVKQKLSKTLILSGGASIIGRGTYLMDQSALKPAFYYVMAEVKF